MQRLGWRHLSPARQGVGSFGGDQQAGVPPAQSAPVKLNFMKWHKYCTQNCFGEPFVHHDHSGTKHCILSSAGGDHVGISVMIVSLLAPTVALTLPKQPRLRYVAQRP